MKLAKWLSAIFLMLLLAWPAQAGNYTSVRKFMKKVKAEQGIHYVLFSGRWCPPCRKLDRLLEQAGLTDKIMIIDVSSNFGLKLMYDLKMPGIPTATIITSKIGPSGKLEVFFSKDYRYGLNECLIFLLAHVPHPAAAEK